MISHKDTIIVPKFYQIREQVKQIKESVHSRLFFSRVGYWARQNFLIIENL